MKITGRSANLGCCGPAAISRHEWAQQWLSSPAATAADLLLLQEVPRQAPTILDATHDVFTPDPADGDYRCRSLVAVRRGCELRGEPHRVPAAGYHGSFVATALVDVPTLGPIVVVSVHASPNPAGEDGAPRWPFDEFPAARMTGRLYDADFVWATVERLAKEPTPVLVAGDWNEARRWDQKYGGTWGKEFFDRVAASGLHDCTWRLWKEERPSCGEYQIDHVFASPVVGDLIDAIDLEWPADVDASDHAQLAFTLDTGRVGDR